MLDVGWFLWSGYTILPVQMPADIPATVFHLYGKIARQRPVNYAIITEGPVAIQMYPSEVYH